MRTFTKYTKDSLWFGKPRDELIIWYFDSIENYIKEKHIEWFKITYLKEKYGWLRVEWQWWDDILFDVCCALENDSEKICHVCWAKGKIRYDLFWFECLCFKHYVVRKIKSIYIKIKNILLYKFK